MTELLLRLFVKDRQDLQNSKTRTAVGSLSGIVGIVCNLLLFTLKLLVGTLAASVSITADAMNNLSDATSSIVTLLGFKLAEKPADEDHPYGHARFEYLSGLAVAVLIIVIGFELAKSSLDKILNPTAVEFGFVTCAVLLGSIAVKLWLSVFNGKLAKMIRSNTLEATATDSRNDCISTLAVLVAALIESITSWKIDGWMGMAVALFILYSGWNLAKETISPLLGEAASQELKEQIVGFVGDHPKVLGYHDLMVHDYGPGKQFASLHVEMDHREDPMDCHELIDDMERECLRSHNVHLVIHYDPVITDDPELTRLKERITALLQSRDERLRLHDFRMVQGKRHMNLVFDVSLPSDLRDHQNRILHYIEDTLNAEGTMVYHVHITFDNAAFDA